ncbi:unnamed protein product [Pleuronectes platessa]|uniref:Uncharacterized protein n=1 Tax=Pleuronectes platessa TaxID=8262 RepID=A0A9N7U128_PLEPL|nr:unnamed protein product [Pleuronectes platessa]
MQRLLVQPPSPWAPTEGDQRSPLAPPDVVSFTYLPEAVLQCAAAGLQTVAPGQTGTEHSELDGLSLSREEIETDYRITVLTIKRKHTPIVAAVIGMCLLCRRGAAPASGWFTLGASDPSRVSVSVVR